MLASLLRAQLVDHNHITISSAGLAAQNGSPASTHACTCMQQRSLDLSQHSSTAIQSCDMNAIDRFYCLTERHAFALADAGIPHEKLFVVNQKNGGVPDPFGGSLAIYEQCAQVLETAAHTIAADLS